ncbi:hypothetical protein BOV94_12800 [Solemya velum gill symbiont]|nr:hypothetical protein BOV94_12800 [Solemya velum gill symbiont]
MTGINQSFPKEIAYKLNKGYTTVMQQLEGARDQLKARNNEQAVVKALILDLITPCTIICQS